MNKLKELLSNKKNIIITIIALLAVLLVITLSLSSEKSKKSEIDISKKKDPSFAEKDLNDIVSGIEDLTVLVNTTDLDYLANVVYNKEIILSIEVDSSKVNLTNTGEYQIAYKVKVDTDKLNEHLKVKNKKNFKETATIEIVHRVTVVSVDEAQNLANQNTAVISGTNSTVSKSDGSNVTVPEKTPIKNGVNASDTPYNTGNISGNSQSSIAPEKPAHSHSWTPVTTVIHHEAQGHYETQVVQAAWDEQIYENRSICNGCGKDITNNIEHIFECDPGSYSNKNIQVGIKHHDAVTKQVWVVDKSAWDETITTGQKCSCGAKK